jgi:quercetin dioxygenase-like cupin family protein
MKNMIDIDLPPDDPNRRLVTVSADAPGHPHFGLVGDTYTVLLGGKDTDQRYCLIDMYIPPGGGPSPHRHDFEESFIVLSGEIEAVFRGQTSMAREGQTLHIPANAPHAFTNRSDRPARLLCICAPAGQEEFFAQMGVPVATRNTAPPKLDPVAERAFKEKAEALAPEFRTELLK